jgi:hypothetical protein
MATFKTVWQFVESNGSTFSEIWYKDGTSISTIVDPASQSVQRRLGFLHPLNSLVRIRVSQVGTLRNTQNVLINKAGQAIGTLGPLPAGAAIVSQVAGVGGGSRKWWMRGNAKDDYARDPVTGVDKPNAGFLQLLQSMFNALNTDAYGILRLTPLANPAVQVSSITQADGKTTPGKTVLTLNQALPVVAGAQVIISRVNAKELPRLNGRFTVISVVGPTITINYATPSNTIVPILNGFIKAVAFDTTHLVDPARSGFDHMGTRTSKSPLSGSRGAKRAGRIRSLA